MFGGGVVRDNQSCEMLNRESCWWAQTWSRDKPIFNHKRDPICFLLDELSLQSKLGEEDQKDAAMVVGMQIHHRGGWVVVVYISVESDKEKNSNLRIFWTRFNKG